MNKKKESMIAFWHINHENTKQKNQKKKFNFDHDQKSHHKTWHEYEDFEIFSVVRKYYNRITLLTAWRSQWNSELVLNHDQK